MIDKEWQNVLKRCRQPSFAFKVSGFLLKEFSSRLSAVIKPANYYPPDVRLALSQTETTQSRAGTTRVEQINTQPVAAVPNQMPLRLAVGYYEFSGKPDWKLTFDDPEQTVSLHRWGWLLTALTETSFPEISQWGLGLMQDWVEEMGDDKSGLPWESYTTGERICNAILFLSLSAGDQNSVCNLPPFLRNAVREMADFLVNRLEYSRPPWTGNHVINNARALYFAGQVLGDKGFTELSTSVFRHDLPELIYADGFLREGSSHYHFVITRWLLEVLWLADLTQDRSTRDLIEPTAKLMVERCWFFLIYRKDLEDWALPLIGDVSPDVSVQWLSDLPWCDPARALYTPKETKPRPRAKGWGSLLNGRAERPLPLSEPSPNQEPRLHEFRESGWYRLEWGPINVFWHIEPQGAPGFASHGHCDIGSLCLFWNGQEILSDPGRFNYIGGDPLGSYGVSARAHNSVLIDGLEPFIYQRRNRYPEFYRKGTANVDVQMDAGVFELSLRHTGFSRLWGDDIGFTRLFRVRRDRLEIEDRIEGHDRHLIETYFQWAPGLEISSLSADVLSVNSRAGDLQAKFSSGPIGTENGQAQAHSELLSAKETPAPGGWYFPGYGTKASAMTLAFRVETTLPYRRQYTLEWGN